MVGIEPLLVLVRWAQTLGWCVGVLGRDPGLVRDPCWCSGQPSWLGRAPGWCAQPPWLGMVGHGPRVCALSHPRWAGTLGLCAGYGSLPRVWAVGGGQGAQRWGGGEGTCGECLFFFRGERRLWVTMFTMLSGPWGGSGAGGREPGVGAVGREPGVVVYFLKLLKGAKRCLWVTVLTMLLCVLCCVLWTLNKNKDTPPFCTPL